MRVHASRILDLDLNSKSNTFAYAHMHACMCSGSSSSSMRMCQLVCVCVLHFLCEFTTCALYIYDDSTTTTDVVRLVHARAES